MLESCHLFCIRGRTKQCSFVFGREGGGGECCFKSIKDETSFWIHHYWQHFPKKKLRMQNHMLVPGGELLSMFNLFSPRKYYS